MGALERIAVTVLYGLLTGEIAGLVTGTLGSGFGLMGFVDDVALFFMRGRMSNWEGLELTIFLDEVEKLIDEAIIAQQETDRQYQARHAALVRWHPDKIYLFGDIDVEDAALMWWSGRELMTSDLVLELFEVSGEAVIVL